MRAPMAAALLAFALPASAADLTLTHQVRLLGPTGVPLEGAIPITVDLHSHETNEALLWTVDLTPTFEQGYASLVLDVGAGNATIDSAWFTNPVWIELTVDGTVLAPRTRVTDVPIHVEPEEKRIFVSGTGWSTAGATLAPSGTVSSDGVTFGPGSTYEVLVRLPLAGAGEYPTGVRADVTIAYELLTEDADPTFFLTDASDNAGPEFCGLMTLDQEGITLYTGAEGNYPGTPGQARAVGSTMGASNDFLVLDATWVLPPGSGTASGYVTGTVESTSLAGECPANVHVQNGVFLDIVRNHPPEQYRIESVHATLRPL